VVAEDLLARLRAVIGDDVEYTEQPVRLGGGFYTANYRFAVRGVPSEWVRPMVLRLFPTHAPHGLDAWEAAVQTCDIARRSDTACFPGRRNSRYRHVARVDASTCRPRSGEKPDVSRRV
jgi:hypothetical protein